MSLRVERAYLPAGEAAAETAGTARLQVLDLALALNKAHEVDRVLCAYVLNGRQQLEGRRSPCFHNTK